MKKRFALFLVLGLFLFIILNSLSLNSKYNLGKTPQQLKIESTRFAQLAKIDEDYKYWQTVVNKYPKFRDAHLKLAQLAFERGQNQISLPYLNNARILDPNYELNEKFTEVLNSIP